MMILGFEDSLYLLVDPVDLDPQASVAAPVSATLVIVSLEI